MASFIATAQNLIDICETAKAIELAKYQALQDRIMAAFETANQGKPVTIDCNGRFHAPCDGYQSAYCDQVYAGGQYIPMPNTEETMQRGSTLYSAKILIIADDQDAIREYARDNFDVGFGKAWNQAGSNVCYAYIKDYSKTIMNAINSAEQAVKALRKEETIKYNQETKETLKDGRYSVTGKVIRTFASAFDNGYQITYTQKMIVELDGGQIVTGTIPKKLDAVVGEIVSFKATFEASKEDPTTGKFTRPTV